MMCEDAGGFYGGDGVPRDGDTPTIALLHSAGRWNTDVHRNGRMRLRTPERPLLSAGQLPAGSMSGARSSRLLLLQKTGDVVLDALGDECVRMHVVWRVLRR